MTDFVRRLVSGNKARFKDGDLDLELDLVYITDQVIVMGYPATGVEGLYRNRREDAKKFLDHRHGPNYWVFNFCPIRENSYDANVFNGRVSRYPFPDHHAPPLAILALAAREMRLWLDGSPERVAVLHCKAGKGRSGTLACSYLLTLDTEPGPPRLERNYSKKDLARHKKLDVPSEPAALAEERQTQVESGVTETAEESTVKKERAAERAEEIMNEMPADEATVAPAPDTDTEEELGGASASTTSLPKSEAGLLKPDSTPGTKLSTDSQHAAEKAAKANGVEPHDFAAESSSSVPTPTAANETVLGGREVKSPVPKSTATSIETPTSAASKRKSLAAVLDLHTARRMRPESPSSSSSSSSPSSSDDEDKKEKKVSAQEADRPGPPPKTGRAGVSIPSQRRWLWYWSLLLADEGPAGFWPALAQPPTPDPAPRVRLLEVQIRMKDGGGGGGVAASAVKAASMLLGRFGEKGTREPGDLWVSLARYDDMLVERLERWERWTRAPGVSGMGSRRVGADVMPLPSDGNEHNEIKDIFKGGKWDKGKMVRSFGRLVVQDGQELREGKIVTETLVSKGADGVTLDVNREVRFKIYMGKVFMAWLWLIPAFHLPAPDAHGAYDPITLTLTKADLDFAVGLGASLVDVRIKLQRVTGPDAQSPPRQSSEQSVGPKDVVGGVLSAVEGPATFREGVEVGQGLED